MSEVLSVSAGNVTALAGATENEAAFDKASKHRAHKGTKAVTMTLDVYHRWPRRSYEDALPYLDPDGADVAECGHTQLWHT